MITRARLFCSVLQVVIIYFASCHGAHIQLFRSYNFTGDLHREIYPTEKCHNVPNHWAFSIITDTCFIAYDFPNCQAPYSSRFMPGKIVPDDFSNGRVVRFDSVLVCNDHEGGPQLNVDITSWFEEKYPPTMPDVLESYHNVCACVNLPRHMLYSNGNWSIDNHGNSLLAYFEPDCAEKVSKRLHINAGHWKNSRDMQKHIKRYGGNTIKIHSFGPDPNALYFRNCPEKSTAATGNTNRPISCNNCISNFTTESPSLGLRMMEQIQLLIKEFQQVSSKVDELKQINQQTVSKIDNIQSFFQDKLQNQMNEFQNLTTKIKDDLGDLFA